jgi:hypothetical protein
MPVFERVIAPKVTLVDLLDRVLDRGLVIDADIIISLAGVPLVGIKLRAALAGMETMVQYGLMREWDNRIRGLTLESTKKEQEPVPVGPAVASIPLFKMTGCERDSECGAQTSQGTRRLTKG